MTSEEHREAVESIKEICQEIGCSGMDPDMCQNRPTNCDIIRKIFFKFIDANKIDKEGCSLNPQ